MSSGYSIGARGTRWMLPGTGGMSRPRRRLTTLGLFSDRNDDGTPCAEPGGDVWEPIHGISIDDYATISARLARQRLEGIESIERWLEGQGVARGTWAEIASRWAQRMAADESVRARYGVRYTRA